MFYRCAHAVVRVVYLLIYRFRVIGLENVPPGGAVVCGNHTSLADPVLVALALRVPDRPYFMAKSELFEIPLFGRLIRWLGAFPVRRGQADLAAVKHSLRLLREGRKVLVFPWGRRVRESETSEIKNGAAMLAHRSGRPILPLCMTQGRKMFVNRIQVNIGKPMDVAAPEGAGKGDYYAEMGDAVMAEIRRLGEEMPQRGRREKRL